MADVKISELTLAAAAGDSVVPASNAAGSATNKVTLGSIANLATPEAIGAAAADHSHEIANINGLQAALDDATTNLTIGTVTTGDAGSNATASVTGTPPNLTLDLTIPRGDTGANGTSGMSLGLFFALS